MKLYALKPNVVWVIFQLLLIFNCYSVSEPVSPSQSGYKTSIRITVTIEITSKIYQIALFWLFLVCCPIKFTSQLYSSQVFSKHVQFTNSLLFPNRQSHPQPHYLRAAMVWTDMVAQTPVILSFMG